MELEGAGAGVRGEEGARRSFGKGRREVEGGADMWAPAGSEREEEGWRVGLGRCRLFGSREKKERGELGWAGEGGVRGKVCLFFFKFKHHLNKSN